MTILKTGTVSWITISKTTCCLTLLVMSSSQPLFYFLFFISNLSFYNWNPVILCLVLLKMIITDYVKHPLLWVWNKPYLVFGRDRIQNWNSSSWPQEISCPRLYPFVALTHLYTDHWNMVILPFSYSLTFGGLHIRCVPESHLIVSESKYQLYWRKSRADVYVDPWFMATKTLFYGINF